ncbi:MAG TPA: cytochrome c [Woeseiaceae bacterium]
MAPFGTSISRGLLSGLVVLVAFVLTMLWLPERSGYAAEPVNEQSVGKAIYDARCASCHGPGGHGTPDQIPAVAPPLSGNPFVSFGTPEALQQVIRGGRTGWKGRYDEYPNMPSFDATMIADLRPLIAYLKGEMQEGAPQSPAEGE